MESTVEHCDAKMPSSTLNVFLFYVGLIFLFYILCKIFLSICRGLYCCFIAPMLGVSVDWKKVGRWAVVTGATDGIGKAYAKALASKGLDIVLISRTLEKLKAVSEEIEEKYKVKTKIVAVNFTGGSEIYDDIRKNLEDLEVGVLVNNVGMSYSYPEYFTKLSDGETMIENIIKANIISCTRMMHLVLPEMEQRRSGVVINVASLSAMYPSPLLSIYSASKVYMDFLSRALYYEYKKKGIIIQSVLPAFVSTKMSRMRPSLDVPTAETYVSWAIKTVGLEHQTYGYPTHKIRGFVMEMMYQYLPEQINLAFIFGVLSDLRKRYYKKFGLVDSDKSSKTVTSSNN